MKFIIIAALLVFHFGWVFACDCKTRNLQENQELGHKNSALIFIGDVHSIDKEAGTYSFKVVEVLKGKTTSKIVIGRTRRSCSGYPSQGRWIVYADFHDDQGIDFSSCGPSRSFHAPERVNAREYVVLPPKQLPESEFSVDAQLLFEKRILALKERALLDLEAEIAQLRNRR
jgi:hypothetical protein